MVGSPCMTPGDGEPVADTGCGELERSPLGPGSSAVQRRRRRLRLLLLLHRPPRRRESTCSQISPTAGPVIGLPGFLPWRLRPLVAYGRLPRGLFLLSSLPPLHVAFGR